MPKALEEKLKKEYSNLKGKAQAHAVYGTMNKMGFMKGNKRTDKPYHGKKGGK